jgi:hypothetical protein
MEEPIYVSRATVAHAGHLHRRAMLALGTAVDMGVHGPIVRFYGLSPARELPLPVDYVVAAAGG